MARFWKDLIISNYVFHAENLLIWMILQLCYDKPAATSSINANIVYPV